MPYIRMPQVSILNPLSHAEHHILYCLCLLDFRYTPRAARSEEFYVTDRDLADFVPCSTSQIPPTKQKLASAGYIAYRIGQKNRTYYRILYP